MISDTKVQAYFADLQIIKYAESPKEPSFLTRFTHKTKKKHED